ncbi:HAMP domain-containing histidine kinase [Streptococcus suis]|nr:HAMP domain-containing histidine kinase [Streptococcus suis]
MSKNSRKKLKIHLLFSVLISFLLAMIVFVIIISTGNLMLEKSIYSESFINKMTDNQFTKLQDYVYENDISLKNLKRLNAWSSRGEKVYLVIYKDNKLVYESYFSDNSLSEQELEETTANFEDLGKEYLLTLNGDVQVKVFLYYYASDLYYYLLTLLSGIIAFAIFLICFIWFINKKIAYVVQLKKELDILSSGQLNYVVTVKDTDELGELAAGINQMRLSILKYQEIQRQMRSANLELITAMSHDLRTPLTSLLAYLEIIERKKYSSEDQFYDLIHKSLGQTMRIKTMADKLFEYFLAYDTEWHDVAMEIVDSDELFGQFIEDYTYSLECQGMNVQIDFRPVLAEIEVNIDMLQRVMDNLYSNLLKYAEPLEIIKISYYSNENSMFIMISNTIRIDKEMSESTNIGLITCRRIIEFHKGTFTIQEYSGQFTVNISLPIKTQET